MANGKDTVYEDEEKYPSRREAEDLLAWAEEQNPGPWAAHSRTVGRSAEVIASACGLDRDKAYVLGLLHDIGRFEGVRDLHHIVAGHAFMVQKGFMCNARICLTHSFPIKSIGVYSGTTFDCSPAELQLIQDTLADAQYNEYDGLIQLCDSISLPQGVCLLEIRLIDVASRHGFNDFTLRKWDALFKLKEHFDLLCARSIYTLFYAEICGTSFS